MFFLWQVAVDPLTHAFPAESHSNHVVSSGWWFDMCIFNSIFFDFFGGDILKPPNPTDNLQLFRSPYSGRGLNAPQSTGLVGASLGWEVGGDSTNRSWDTNNKIQNKQGHLKTVPSNDERQSETVILPHWFIGWFSGIDCLDGMWCTRWIPRFLHHMPKPSETCPAWQGN